MRVRQMLVVLVSLCLPVWAAYAGELDRDQVARFLASMEELQTSDRYIEALAGAYPADDLAPMHPGSRLVSEVTSLLSPEVTREALAPVILDHGFSGVGGWARTGDRVLLAVLSHELGEAAPALIQEIESLKHETRNNEQLSEQQKARMQAMLADSSQLVERVMAVDAADRKAVEPWLGELKRVLAYGR